MPNRCLIYALLLHYIYSLLLGKHPHGFFAQAGDLLGRHGREQGAESGVLPAVGYAVLGDEADVLQHLRCVELRAQTRRRPRCAVAVCEPLERDPLTTCKGKESLGGDVALGLVVVERRTGDRQ